MHDTLFARQRDLGVVSWDLLAKAAGVPDIARFMRCISGDSVLQVVRADAVVAQNIKSRGTPTVVLRGGGGFVGVPSKSSLDSLLAKLSARARRP